MHRFELLLPLFHLGITWQMISGPFIAVLRPLGLFPKPLLPPQDVDLSGRVAIVTGANTGE